MAPKRDPAREAFESVAPSSSTIRSARSKMHAACTTCLKREGPGVELRRCGKCKSICYCSKQCQTKNWPEHKKMCGGMDGTGLLRLVQALWANDLLTVYLQACCVLDCDLRHNPRADKPFMARIDFGIEPTDVVDLFKIFFGESTPTKFKAMLQLNGFTASRTTDIASLPYRAKEIWLQERARADAHGLKEQPLGLVEMCNGDGGLGIMLPLLIDKAAMRLVDNSEPWEIHTPGIGQVTHRPFTIETCMEFVNSHIRQDKKNQLRLRADMRPSDMKTIVDAAAGSDGLPARLLREKMARELIYEPLVTRDDMKPLFEERRCECCNHAIPRTRFAAACSHEP